MKANYLHKSVIDAILMKQCFIIEHGYKSAICFQEFLSEFSKTYDVILHDIPILRLEVGHLIHAALNKYCGLFYLLLASLHSFQAFKG